MQQRPTTVCNTQLQLGYFNSLSVMLKTFYSSYIGLKQLYYAFVYTECLLK